MSSQIYNNILEIIGNTPIVKLNKLPDPSGAQVFLKLEYMNPSDSLKDRIAVSMIEDAAKRGLLKPGGAVVEASSGNTAAAVALTAAVKGYRAILVVSDKQSKEKIDAIKAFGAEVVIVPSTAKPEDPDYYLNKAKSIADSIPGSYFTSQFTNDLNPESHYNSTGKEIWEQTDGKIDVFVMGMGTGGTISGVGKYLKEKNPDIKIIGADPAGSLLKGYLDTGKLGEYIPYKVEGIGEDEIPKTLNMEYVDEIITVTDKESFSTARRLTREEGIYCGGSTGTHVFAAMQYAKKMSPDKVIVTFAADAGSKYLSKCHNDDWMRENGFLE